MNVILYRNFHKDINSTKIPTSGSGASESTFSCEVYDNCSIIDPIIIINSVGTTLQSNGYTYAWIPTWNRLYWITDMVYQDGRWFVHLSVDVLGTYRSHIGGSTQYCLRAASEYDEWIIDDIYVPISGKKQLKSVFAGSWPNNNPFASGVSTGIFVAGIAGGAPTFGALRYYAFTLPQFDSFINYLLGNTTYMGDLGDVTADMSKLILNPLQYIQSCLWFPFTISPLGAFSTSVQVGWWTIPTDAMLVTMSDGATRQIGYGITSIPIHPQAATIGNYLRREPFSNYRIWVPPVGYVTIPADLLCDVDFVNVAYTVDIVNGSTLIDLWAGSNTPGTSQKRLYSTQAQLAVDVPLAQVMGVGNNVMQGIQQISSGKILGGIEKLVTGGIGAWMGSEISGGAVQGSTGSTAVYRRVPDLVLDYTEMAETAPTIMGRPLCKNKVINTLSGYIMTAHAHIDIYGATKQEIEAIETYMDGGFFYE